MQNKLNWQFPSQGWSQILTSRKEMLDAYDRAREKSRSHETEVFHGKVAEAEFRKWLSGLLPKRYAVTSGYIVSPGLPSTAKTPHFDVIIYDHLEAPVLWIEDHPDASPQGRSLAIPVEHVRLVLEIKASFSSANVEHALEHLCDLLPVMAGPDDPSELYKLHLPPTFGCGLVFFELRQESAHSEAALDKIIRGNDLRGFFGGIILRGERHSYPLAGRFDIYHSKTPVDSTVNNPKGSLLDSWRMSESVKIADNFYIGSMLDWGESNFSHFAFDLIAIMGGTYKPGGVSSLYGLSPTVINLDKLFQ